jgi:hypothetical protein
MDDQEGADDNAIRVCIRVRPLNSTELERGDTSTCTVMPDGRTIRLMHYAESRRKWESQMLKFEKVFGPDASQIDVFHQSGVEAFCDAAAEGFAATVFCFGQTGSGKTFTMTGPIDEANPDVEVQVSTATQGIQFRAMHYFASLIEASRAESTAGEVTLTVKAAMYEIYNEQVNDLLNETTNLKVRWSQPQQGFFIESLMIVTCSNLGDLLAVLQQGLSQRKRAAHMMNQDSSRSHVVLSLGVERQRSDGAPPTLGKINFVDLAGSEKLRDSGSQGVNATETKNINTSLLALGKVITALAARSGEAFVPYRDSTLTRLLMDSLGGNAKTLMLACVTPSSKYAEESIKTIRYAVRASSIVNMAPTVRVDPRRLEVFELRTELDMLKKENAMLKERLAQFTSGGSGAPPPVNGRLPPLAPTPVDPWDPRGNTPPSAMRAGGYASQYVQQQHQPPPQHQQQQLWQQQLCSSSSSSSNSHKRPGPFRSTQGCTRLPGRRHGRATHHSLPDHGESLPKPSPCRPPPRHQSTDRRSSTLTSLSSNRATSSRRSKGPGRMVGCGRRWPSSAACSRTAGLSPSPTRQPDHRRSARMEAAAIIYRIGPVSRQRPWSPLPYSCTPRRRAQSRPRRRVDSWARSSRSAQRRRNRSALHSCSRGVSSIRWTRRPTQCKAVRRTCSAPAASIPMRPSRRWRRTTQRRWAAAVAGWCRGRRWMPRCATCGNSSPRCRQSSRCSAASSSRRHKRRARRPQAVQ